MHGRVVGSAEAGSCRAQTSWAACVALDRASVAAQLPTPHRSGQERSTSRRQSGSWCAGRRLRPNLRRAPPRPYDPRVAAQPTLTGAPAHFDKGLREVGRGAWAWLQPNGAWGEANAGLIAGDGEALLVDTLWDEHLAGEMLEAMASALAGRT